MSAEDQVLLHMLSLIEPAVPVFTLDTGRLFEETYSLIEATKKKYKTSLNIYFPDALKVEEMVSKKGINLFYESIENRKLCCQIRKQEPLQRALTGYNVWICGLRKDQSVTRFYSQVVEWDEAHTMLKINPLINWTESMVWDYIKNHSIPFNQLHDKGFPSIGCRPCTRAIKPGEDIRAGRWWWEQQEQKECGLHREPTS
jgi:phosphoadenosine phosphosulfate reductase